MGNRSGKKTVEEVVAEKKSTDDCINIMFLQAAGAYFVQILFYLPWVAHKEKSNGSGTGMGTNGSINIVY